MNLRLVLYLITNFFIAFNLHADFLENTVLYASQKYQENIPIFRNVSICKKIVQTTNYTNNNQNIFKEDKFFQKIKRSISFADKEIIISTYGVNYKEGAIPKALNFISDGIQELKKRLENDPNAPVVNIYFLADHNFINKSGNYMRNLGLFDSPSSKIKISTKIYDHKLFGSTHSKVFIIDGQVGMITGANILEGHFRESKWFDQAVWAHSQNLWLYVRNNIFKPLWEKGSLVNNVEQILPLNLNSIEDRKHLSIPCLPKNRALAKIALFASKRNKLNLTNTLNKNRSKGILSSIENARNNIKIFSPNFNADHPVSAIKKLLIKGVNVKIMVNSSEHKNIRKPIFEGKNSKEIYKELLKFIKQKKPSGRLEFKYFSRDGNTAALKSLENTSHSKFMAIDNKAIILGSSNMDPQSWYRSGETDYLIGPENPNDKFVENIIKYGFDKIWKNAVNINIQ